MSKLYTSTINTHDSSLSVTLYPFNWEWNGSLEFAVIFAFLTHHRDSMMTQLWCHHYDIIWFVPCLPLTWLGLAGTSGENQRHDIGPLVSGCKPHLHGHIIAYWRDLWRNRLVSFLPMQYLLILTWKIHHQWRKLSFLLIHLVHLVFGIHHNILHIIQSVSKTKTNT